MTKDNKRSNTKIHSDTIDNIKTHVDIVDFVSKYVVLKKSGKDYVGLCPFHKENHPSFSVSQSKQMFYCFGCGTGGDVIKFDMDLNHHSFHKAVTDLSWAYNIPIKFDSPDTNESAPSDLGMKYMMYEIMERASQFYLRNLHERPGVKALKYLTDQRGISIEYANKFGIGYSLPEWRGLYIYLVKEKHYDAAVVESVGLIKSSDGGKTYYDFFRDRLMIPIRDTQGRVIAFGGRDIGSDPKKYLNSPSTPLFDKKNTLFALDCAKDAIAENDSAIVVEGYFDAISLHMNGINNVVASMGTALNACQMRMLSRYSKSNNIILSFDSDEAGTRASWAAINESHDISCHGFRLKVAEIVGAKDADEFVRLNGRDKYIEMIDKSPHWVMWQISRILKGRDLSSFFDFDAASKSIIQLLSTIPDTAVVNYYVPVCADLLSRGNLSTIPYISESIRSQIGTTDSVKSRNKIALKSKHMILGGSKVLDNEMMLIKLYIHYPEYRQCIKKEIDGRGIQFTASHTRRSWQLIRRYDSDISKSPESIICEMQHDFMDVGMDPDIISSLFDNDAKFSVLAPKSSNVISFVINCMEISALKKRCHFLLELWEKTDAVAEKNKSERYYRLFHSEKLKVQHIEKSQSEMISSLIHGRADMA
jgi:DNA primase